MASGSTYHPPLTTRQLLVSVQNADEATVAFQCGVPWVDLKNPAAGSLGQPSTESCIQFLDAAARYPSSQISLALGEMGAVDWEWVAHWLPAFAVGKVGLSGQTKVDQGLVATLSEFKGRIVPALYADWQRASAPSPEQVVRLAAALDAPFLLIDTFIKDGRGLLEWLSIETIKELQCQMKEFGAELVIAGSLRTRDWSMLEKLEHVTIGVRGAVCETNADRSSRLSQPAIEEWMRFCSN